MTYIFYIITLFLFTTGQIFRIAIGNGLVVQLTDIVVFMNICIWLFSSWRSKNLKKQFQHPLTKGITLFAGIGLLTLVCNSFVLSMNHLSIAALYLFRWVVYALIFYQVKSFSNFKKQKLLNLLMIFSALIVSFGYIQYIFYPNLRNLYYLGWDDHLYRMFSTLLDPNFAGALFALFLIFFLSYLFTKKFTWEKDQVISSLLCIVTFIALLLTYSRSAFFSFSIGVIILFLLLQKKLYLFALLGLLIIGIILIPKNLHSSGVELWRTASIFARTESAQQAIKIFVDHPIIGVGFDAYRYAQKSYGFAAGDNWEISHSGGGTDNSFLFILATSGVIGFLAYLFLWKNIIFITWESYKNTKTKHTFLPLAILASIGVLFIDSFFVNSLFYTIILFWFWTVLGLIY